MASAFPRSRQGHESTVTGAGHSWSAGSVADEVNLAQARSLQSALENVDSLHLYARSIVRMLEACEADAGLPRARGRHANAARARRRPMDLDFVRDEVDRLAGEVHAQLALLSADMRPIDR